MDMNRRSFLQGAGGVSMALLFRSKAGPLEHSWTPDRERRPPSGAEVVVTPKNHFRPERLVVADNIAEHFIIENITIGSVAMFAGGSVPAAIFSSSAIDVHARLPVVMAGQEIRFQIRRMRAQKHVLRRFWDFATFKKEIGIPFQGAIVGYTDYRRMMLPITSPELF